MRYVVMLALVLAVGGVCTAVDTRAQTTTEPPASTSPPAPSANTVTPTTPAPPPGPKAGDVKGLDVFGSDGQQVGRVVNATETPEGRVKDVEVHSRGFFGYFATAYFVPGDKVTVKGGRVELSVPSDQAKQWAK